MTGTACAADGAPAEPWQARPDLGAAFAREGVHGTIAVIDERNGSFMVSDAERAAMRLPPASTFKIPHALFALEAGVVADEFQRFAWDGTRHGIAGWNRDQDLRSSMRDSVVWVYQGFARAIGEPRERDFLQRADYGNADASGGVDRFWLDGGLRISAIEQLRFLRRLHRNALPFAVAHQRLVKDIIVVEAGHDWILRAKSGWATSATTPDDGRQVGWWVGWVEHRDGAVFFALNIDMPNAAADLPKRERIARAILRELGALPGDAAH
jgi:beta-lactamase class D